MTGSEILATAWDIADDDWSQGDTLEDFEAMRDDAVERIEELVDLIDEKLSNIEDGMGHTDVPVYYDLEERRDMYDEWRDAVEAVDFTDCVDDDHVPACLKCGLSYEDGPHWAQDDDFDHEYEADDTDEAPFDSEAAAEALQEAIDACPE